MNVFGTLPRGARKGFKNNRNSHYEIIKKIKIESMIEFILSKVTCIS